MDAQKYKSSFVEEIDSDGNEYETFLEKNKKQNQIRQNHAIMGNWILNN